MPVISRESRAVLLASLIGVGWVIVLIVVLMWNSILLNGMQNLHLNDLGKFYYDARAFAFGTPMYEPSPATLIPISETGSKQFLNLNPPHFHLALLPFVWLEPKVLLVLWLLTGVLALALSLRATFNELGVTPSAGAWLGWGLYLVSTAAFGSILNTGQITLHLLPFVTWAWISTRRRHWVHAGTAIGILVSIKSFFLVFLPWLTLRGRALTVVTAVGVTASAYVIGIGVFGTAAWEGWLSAMAAIDWYGQPLDASLRSYIVRLFGHTLHYEPLIDAPDLVMPLWITGFGLIGCISVGMAIVDRTPQATDRSFTLLILGALLMSPLGWIYYVLLAAPPAIGLLSAARSGYGHHAFTRVVRWGRGAAIAAGGCALLVPTVVTALAGTTGFLTLTIGSAHFWAVWFLWCAVVCDGLLAIGLLDPHDEVTTRARVPVRSSPIRSVMS